MTYYSVNPISNLGQGIISIEDQITIEQKKTKKAFMLGALLGVVPGFLAGYFYYEWKSKPKPFYRRRKNIPAAKRRSLKKSEFGLPGKRKYPIFDRRHGANALARARQQLERGNLSQKEYGQIRKRVCDKYDFPSCS